MSEVNCPKCQSEYAYQDGNMWVCPECAHEWNENDTEVRSTNDETVVKDAHGNVLNDGDTVIVIKDLKIKGSKNAVKGGTKVKGIRLTPDSSDGHDISCKIDGFGAMGLKSEYVKKA
jgi:protein PhnA